jgi:hypothetical protein
MKLARLLVIILPLFTWLLAQSYLIWPEFFYIAFLLSAAAIIATTFLLRQAGPKIAWYLPAILPLVFLFSAAVYISFSTNQLLIQLLFLVILVFQFNYFKSLYYFWNRPDLYSEGDMKITKAYSSFLTVFWLAANIYGFQSLLNFEIWPMLLLFIVLVLTLIYVNLKTDSHDSKVVWQFSVLITLVVTEVAWVFVFLPLNYNVSGLVVAIIYYLISNLVNLYLQNALTSKKIKLYITLSSIGLAILLFTASWLN